MKRYRSSQANLPVGNNPAGTPGYAVCRQVYPLKVDVRGTRSGPNEACMVPAYIRPRMVSLDLATGGFPAQPGLGSGISRAFLVAVRSVAPLTRVPRSPWSPA